MLACEGFKPLKIQTSRKGGFLLEEIELVFVYNADSGVFHAFGDYVHKIVTPATYPCKLCAITYGMGGMKNDWKKFVESRELPVKFLHKDEFAEQYPDKKEDFPCAFLKKGDELELFISAGEINRTGDLEDLKALVSMKIKKLNLKEEGSQ